MKIALVHELFTMRGGAERVLRVLADMFPDAPIYTLLYNEKKLGEWFPKDRVRTSTLQKYAKFSTNHHLYLPWFPAAVQAWDFSEFDLVISSSSAFAHGIITNRAPKHVCYVHSPARYLWDRTHDVVEQAGKGPMGFLRKQYLQHVFHKLRVWDAESADRADVLLAASAEVQRRIELYWRRESTVLHPPIDDMWLQAKPQQVAREQPSYFLIVSTLARYKRIDLAIDACNALGMHLKIVGEGPDRSRLERKAGPTIEFYGYRERDELIDLYGGAIATIVPGEEDFCLVALESMACGTPVIGYGKGGITETVTPGKTGEFFSEPNVDSISSVLKIFDQKKYSKEECIATAAQHSRRTFEEGLQQEINRVMAT